MKHPTAATTMWELKRILSDGKGADGKYYFKPEGRTRGSRKTFTHWVRYLKLDLTLCKERFYREGWPLERVLREPKRKWNRKT